MIVRLLIAAVVMALSAVGTRVEAQATAARVILYRIGDSTSERTLVTPASTVGDGQCMFNRIVGIVMLSSGGMVAGNAGNHELCVFDVSGKLLSRVGRNGQGPGEFEMMTDIGSYVGDSVLVLDAMSRRLTIMSTGRPGARTVSALPPISTLGTPNLAMALADASLVLGFSEFVSGPPSPTAQFLTQRLFHSGRDGSKPVDIGSMPMREHFIQKVAPEMGGVAYWDLVFGRSFSAAPFRNGFVGGDGTDFTVHEYAPSGAEVARHVLPLRRGTIPERGIAAYKESSIQRASPARRALEERRVTEMPYPKEYPAYRNLLVDAGQQTIWLELYPSVGSVIRRWIRLTPTNGTAQRFRFPDRFRLLAVRGGKACGVRTDDSSGLEEIACFDTR